MTGQSSLTVQIDQNYFAIEYNNRKIIKANSKLLSCIANRNKFKYSYIATDVALYLTVLLVS